MRLFTALSLLVLNIPHIQHLQWQDECMLLGCCTTCLLLMCSDFQCFEGTLSCRVSQQVLKLTVGCLGAGERH